MAVPEFNPGGSSPLTFAGSPAISAIGTRSQAAEFRATAKLFDTVADTAIALFSLSQNESSRSSYTSNLISDSKLHFRNLAATAKTPDEYLKQANAFIDGTASTLPEEFKDAFISRARVRATSEWIQINKKFSEELRDRSSKDLDSALVESETDILRTGLPTNLLEQEVLTGKLEDHRFLLDKQEEAGFITAGEKSLKIDELLRAQSKEQAWNLLQASGQPMALIVRAMEGDVGISQIDNLSAGEKSIFLDFAFKKNSAIQQLKAQEAAQQKVLVKGQRVQSRLQISSEPLGVNTDANLQKLRVLAETEAEFREVEKWEDFVDNHETERYTESDQVLKARFEGSLARGALTEEQVFTVLGEGLSTEDFKGFIKDIREQKDSLVTSNTFQFILAEWQNKLPPPERKAPWIMLGELLAGGKISTPSTGQAQFEENESLTVENFLDLQREILVNKSITTEEEMLKFMSARLQTILQGRSQAKIPSQNSMTLADVSLEASTGRLSPFVDRYRNRVQDLYPDFLSGRLPEITSIDLGKIQKLLEKDG